MLAAREDAAAALDAVRGRIAAQTAAAGRCAAALVAKRAEEEEAAAALSAIVTSRVHSTRRGGSAVMRCQHASSSPHKIISALVFRCWSAASPSDSVLTLGQQDFIKCC